MVAFAPAFGEGGTNGTVQFYLASAADQVGAQAGPAIDVQAPLAMYTPLTVCCHPLFHGAHIFTHGPRGVLP